LKKSDIKGVPEQFERLLVATALGHAALASLYDREAFVCVLVSGLFTALNFRIWRIVGALSTHVPSVVYAAIGLKVPFIAAGIWALLKLGEPWMVGVGVVSKFTAAVIWILFWGLKRRWHR
jgi:Na+-transporting NADH:ubiquinone oxidoreductase subunit NqrA